MYYTTLDKICDNLDYLRKPITGVDRISGDIPYYGASGIVDYVHEHIFDEKLLLVSEDGANLLARTTPIAFSIEGKAWINNHAHVLRFKDEILQKCVELYLNSISLEPYITGTAQPKLNQKMLNEIPIPIINKEIMESIVKTIDKLKYVIDKRKEELEELDNLIKSRFVEMFGHQSHNEKLLPYLTIDDVAEIYLGITHTPTYVENGVMFISAKNTSGDFLDLSDVKYISKEEFEGAPKGSKPQINDVLFSRVGSNLGHPVILKEDLELCTFVSLGFLRTKGNVTSNYLKHWMRDDFFAKQVSEHVKGGGQPNLNTGWLKEFKIIVPDIESQREFDDFCNQVDKLKFI